MATKNSAELIDEVVNYLDKQVTVLTHREKINVQMRIDEAISILQHALDLAKDDQSSRKFDLTIDAGTNTTVTVTRGESTVSAGSNVLTYGDVITISASADTDYNLTTFKINGKSYDDDATITVTTDITVETEATADEPVEP